MYDERSRELITRGNLDGIVSAAVFLRRFPRSPVRFVTSPAAAAGLLRSGGAEHAFLADIALTPSLASAVEEVGRHRPVTLIDHHESSLRAEWAVIDVSTSAAGLMYHQLAVDGMDAAVSLADLYENEDTPLLRSMMDRMGIETLRRETEVLDFAWRLNVKDDAFRLAAAEGLASGLLPSCVAEIAERHAEMVRRDGCRYAVMINRGERESVVSLRSTAPGGVDLGRFVESFTAEHGVEGGGHPASAGARIPSDSAELLIEQLEALA